MSTDLDDDRISKEKLAAAVIAADALLAKAKVEAGQQLVQLDKGDVNIKYVLVIIVAIVGYVALYYNTTVLPIATIQVQLAQIQVTLKQATQNFTTLNAEVQANTNAISVLQDKIK